MGAAKKTITCEAEAGFQDKGDVLVRLKPGSAGSGVTITLESRVMALFGEQIRSSVEEEITQQGLTDVEVEVFDKGALDFTIKARTQTAIERALKGEK